VLAGTADDDFRRIHCLNNLLLVIV
jgi:hypothetical protein